MKSVGILVGCDQNQEWLLSWWYSHLRQHHPDIPIAFGDLGMSENGKRWCEQRGTLISASHIPPMPEIKGVGWPLLGEKWIQKNLKPDALKPQRSAWFRKPFLMKQTPFEKTLWLDLDCQVLKSLSPILSLSLNSTKMTLRKSGEWFWICAIGKDQEIKIRGYNSGVVLFEKNSVLLDFWIFLLSQEFRSFDGDDYLLSFGIQIYGFSPAMLPCKYNWEPYWGQNAEAVIYHYMGARAKCALRLLTLLTECKDYIKYDK